jgi:flagellar M-ring protein FliF
MPAIDVDKLKEQGKRFTSGFTAGQKAVTILAVVGVFAAMFMFTKWAGKPDYSPLFTDLDTKAAGEVTQALDSQGIPYELTDGGRTVMVPKDKIYKTRADLSTEGIPNATTDGWSIMDQGGITRDEFSKRVDYQRALQTELARTISAIDGIEGATVNLTIPQQSVFVDAEDDQASAAVLVTPTGGSTLGTEKVQAIVNLVSSSVPSLKPEKVTVADSLGNMLSAPGQDGQFANSQQLEQKAMFESKLKTQLESLVAASLGPGHAAVSVTADLDFDNTTEERTTNSRQGNGVPTEESTKRETWTGGSPGGTGVLGPGGTPAGTGTDQGEYSNTETSRRYAVNSVRQVIERAPGDVVNLSAAVLLDGDKVGAGDLAQWEETIAAAAAIDTERGDILSVNRAPFDESVQEAADAQVKTAEAAESQDFLLNLLRYVVTLLIVGAVLFLAWRSVKRAGVGPGPVRVPLDLRELEASDLVSPRLESPYDRPQLAASAKRMPLDAGLSSAELELTDLIERQPDEVAQTLRSWLADRRS